MITVWVLVLILGKQDGTGEQRKRGPFIDEASCTAAGDRWLNENINTEFLTVTYTCRKAKK